MMFSSCAAGSGWKTGATSRLYISQSAHCTTNCLYTTCNIPRMRKMFIIAASQNQCVGFVRAAIEPGGPKGCIIANQALATRVQVGLTIRTRSKGEATCSQVNRSEQLVETRKTRTPNTSVRFPPSNEFQPSAELSSNLSLLPFPDTFLHLTGNQIYNTCHRMRNSVLDARRLRLLIPAASHPPSFAVASASCPYTCILSHHQIPSL